MERQVFGLDKDERTAKFCMCVSGVYPSKMIAENARVALEIEGFDESSISIYQAVNSENRPPVGSFYGSGVGATIGMAFSLFATNSGGGVFSLAMGIFFGSILGGALGVLIGLTLNQANGFVREDDLANGKSLLIVKVHSQNSKNKALIILDESGAEDISIENDPQKTARDHGDLSLTH